MADLPSGWRGTLRLPVISAPMFLASGPDLVVACGGAGIAAALPALNCRRTPEFANWLEQIEQRRYEIEAASGVSSAPFGVNLIVHHSNDRLEADLEVCIRHRVPFIVTSMGAVPDLVARVHDYGGIVLHDVATLRHAEKAIVAGVDGLIVLGAGAGGHGGTRSPFALLAEVRRCYSGLVVLGGAISSGTDIAAALTLGADLVYMGTRFLATRESLARDAYKEMLLASNSSDVVFTPGTSDVPGNYLRASLEAAGFTVAESGNAATRPARDTGKDAAPWRDLWSAGHGVGTITDIPTVAELADRLAVELCEATTQAQLSIAKWTAA